MSVGIGERLEAELGRLRGAERVSFREVEACLKRMWPVLMAAGCTEAGFSKAAGRIIDALVEGAVLAGPEAGVAAAGVIGGAIFALPAVSRAMARAAGHGQACALCDGAAGGGAGARGGHFRASMAMPDRRVTISGGLRVRKRFRGAQGLFTCDHSHPALDRAAVRRLLGMLGPDFGPEPPTGGSLARV